ncbi:hypothetical protein EG832_08025, partial [bacterium]|nr:hypothetical protein [bacterium]
MKKSLTISLVLLMFVVSCSLIQKPAETKSNEQSGYEPLATATAYEPQKSKANLYTNEEYGFSVSIPSGFTATDAAVDA